MASAKQTLANRANSQLSTGPASEEGRIQSACNSFVHGLNASREILFAARPGEQSKYEAHTLRLRKACLPTGDLEEDAFLRYTWSTFQVTRARSLEIVAEDRWVEDPDDLKRFSQMERTIKLAAMHERRASKALADLRQVQRDRFAAYEVYAEHCVMGKEVAIPESLPIAAIRASDLNRTNPNYLAQFLLYSTPDVQQTARQMLADAKKNEKMAKSGKESGVPQNPLYNMSMEELMGLATAAGLKK